VEVKKNRQKEGQKDDNEEMEKESIEIPGLISRNHNARTRMTLASRRRIWITRVENIKKNNDI